MMATGSPVTVSHFLEEKKLSRPISFFQSKPISFELDINECEDPTLSSFCVENAECWNLPGHFVCKCQDGVSKTN